MAPYYELATPLVPASHQPALLADHLRSLDLDPAALLRGTGLGLGIFDGPWARQALLTPQHYAALLANAARAVNDPEFAFQFGRQLLPGHYGAASRALLTAGSLRQALHAMTRHAARLSPLLAPHWAEEGGLAVLYWTDTGAGPGQRAFLVEAQMSAVAAACRWLAGERLPWRFAFNRGAPRECDAHEAHLGTRLRFACHLDAMMIGAEWLDRPWPRAAGAVDDAGETPAEAPQASFLGALYDHLLGQVRRPPGLDDTAAAFGLSPATFKRRLAAHGTHYQAELDRVRLHAALGLMHARGLDNDEVGRWLGFDDAANFRRSMKRWAGLTPAQLRQGLAG